MSYKPKTDSVPLDVRAAVTRDLLTPGYIEKSIETSAITDSAYFQFNLRLSNEFCNKYGLDSDAKEDLMKLAESVGIYIRSRDDATKLLWLLFEKT